jgi:predicted MPP superfamily phosphohydrolase
VDRVNACRPDLICLTGDYVDGYVSKLAGDVEPLCDLKAPDGVYVVRGNHEYFLDYEEWRKWFADNGFRLLVNECVFPRKSLALGGVNDTSARRRRDERRVPRAAGAQAARRRRELGAARRASAAFRPYARPQIQAHGPSSQPLAAA